MALSGCLRIPNATIAHGRLRHAAWHHGGKSLGLKGNQKPEESALGTLDVGSFHSLWYPILAEMQGWIKKKPGLAGLDMQRTEATQTAIRHGQACISTKTAALDRCGDPLACMLDLRTA